MSSRPSQTPSYWTTDFSLTQADVDALAEQALERERPITISDLTQTLVESRLQREDQRIRRELARGKLYQPQDEYEIGETLVFPVLDFAVGVVTAKRPGKNPEHGDFDVISVTMEESQEGRIFAAALKTPHRLNREEGDDGLGASDSTTVDEILDRHEPQIRGQLEEQLSEWQSPTWVSLGRYWLPGSMLADVHIGHLNIAEALIEVQSRPLATGELLPDLDIPQEIPLAVAAFSVDYHLSDDERFADVGFESHEWYLERLLPEEAVTIPRRLRKHDDPYDRSLLNVPLLQLEWELDDEWTVGGTTTTGVAQLPSITLTLNYPHRRSGTLPITDRTRGFFPVRPGRRSMFTFIDGRWGNRFPGWVVPEGRYVAGLGAWFTEHNLPVGAYVTLERTEVPTEVVVDFRPRRMKREWVRMARVEDDLLVFQLQKQAISCEYDSEMIVAEGEPEAIDELRRALYRRDPTVYDLLEQMAPDLMGQSTQGTVHAKTLYSAINIVRRTTPGPIFAALVGNPRFRDAGDGHFGLARR